MKKLLLGAIIACTGFAAMTIYAQEPCNPECPNPAPEQCNPVPCDTVPCTPAPCVPGC